LGVIWSSRTVN